MDDVTANDKKQEILRFLREVRTRISTGNFTFLRRCTDSLANLGLTIAQARQEIFGLRLKHYDRGPTSDYNNDGTDIWEFGKIINGKMTYIKLKIHPERGCICMSFKESHGPFTLPYK